MYKLQTIYRLQEKIIRDSSEISMIIHMNDDKELLDTYSQLLAANYTDKIQAKVIIKNMKKKLVDADNSNKLEYSDDALSVNDSKKIIKVTDLTDYYSNIKTWTDASISFFKLFESKYSKTVNDSIINDCMKCIFNSGKLKYITNY